MFNKRDMYYPGGIMRKVVKTGLKIYTVVIILLYGVVDGVQQAAAEESRVSSSWNSSFEGGRGLMYMNSARTYGKGHVITGLQGLTMNREYPLGNAGSREKSYTTVLGVPLTFGITDELDLSGVLYYFNDARPFLSENDVTRLYGDETGGIGSVRIALKGRLPYSIQNAVQIGAKVGATFDSSKDQIDGLNYRWTRTATDIDFSFLETLDLAPFASLNFEEGYVLSGDDYYDDQWIFAAGIDIRPHDRFGIGLEVHNRTFRYSNPLSALQDDRLGAFPAMWESKDGVPQVGDSRYIKDDALDFDEDFLVVAPSVSVYVTPSVSLTAGALINVADQGDPKETAQYMLGITYNGRLNFLLDTDSDGIKDNKDREVTPAGYPVDEWGISLDTDGDGVVDGADREIETPEGAVIDSYGVGVDGDRDGVYDGLDRQPQTPPGCEVDEWGIALDTDGDGVPNCLDKQLDTRRDCEVDEFGVALDDDEDGVPNCIDREPHSPANCRGQVDEFGVAFDDDGDGVANCVDLEPDTASGTPVDKFGRGVKADEERALLSEGIIRVHRIHFATGKAVITADSYAMLQQIADLLAKYPALKIRIEGHTDSTGSVRYNKRLSLKRANAVLEYLLEYRKDLVRDRFEVAGIGPDEPVATNDTEFGRQMNRRVEFEVINKDALKNLKPVE